MKKLLASGLLAAAVAVLAGFRVRGAELDIYAGPEINTFSMLHDTETTEGFGVGARYWLLPILGLDAGVTDFGKVVKGFPVEATYPPGQANPLFVLPTQGTNSLDVSSLSFHLLAETRLHWGDRLGLWLGMGPEIATIRATSNLQVGYPTFRPTYSGTRSSCAFMTKAGLDYGIGPSLSLGFELHYSRSPAFDNFSFYPEFQNADIGSRQLQVLGGGVQLVWRLR
jgi:opacity protein-like surface antigen